MKPTTEKPDAPQMRSLFLAALDRPAGPERTAYLDEVCGSDRDLRTRLDALLKAHDEAGLFLQPLPDLGNTEPETALTEAPGTVIGRYKLMEKIGEGGMAVVYMAEQTEPIRRKVALKIIKLGMDTHQVIARFEAERQALALMDHPSIAKVLDAGATETGRPYFAMELVQGVSITEYCDKNSLSTKERLALFLQVCHAMQHAHQKGIIHRDIKPSNVMVTHHDGKPVPKVIDFGIAKATNQRLTEKTLFTRYAHLIGTPAYMSPEQAQLSDLDIDTRSDIYSLGVLLYELLTGTTPFSEEELRRAGYLEMQRVIREQEPVKPSTRIRTTHVAQPPSAGELKGSPPRAGVLQRRPGDRSAYQQVRGDLDWIVMKTLEKERARRYETVSSLADDIRRHLHNEPVLAGSPSVWYRASKFVRRHRTHLAATTAVAVAVIAGFIASIAMYLRAEHARSETRLVSDFFTDDLLASIYPEKAKGQAVTVRYILDNAVKDLDKKLQASPLSEAKVRETIGLAYQKLGDYEAAELHLRRAWGIRRQQLGEADLLTLTSLHYLGTLQVDQGRYKDAEALLLKASEMRRKRLGEEHPDTLASLGNLAWLYLCEGRVMEGDALARNVLNTGRRILGEEHPVVLRSMATSAFLSILMFRFKDAHQLANDGFEISRRVSGEEHEQTLLFMTQITWACIFEKQYDTAEEVGTRALDLCRKVLGQEHMLTALAMSHLGSIYKDLGHYDKAYPFSSQAVEIAQRVLGEGHLFTLYFMSRLVMLYDLQKQYDPMETLLAQAIVLCRQNPGAGLLSGDISWRARGRIAALGTLAREHYEAGRYAEALSTIVRQEDLCRVLSPDVDERVPSDLAVQTMALHQLGDKQKAQNALDRLRGKYENGDHPCEAEHLYRAEQLATAGDSSVHHAWELLRDGELDRVRETIEALPVSADRDDPNRSVLSLRKATARAYCVRGKIAEFRGDYEDAGDAYQTAIDILPNYAPTLFELAQLRATCPAQGLRDGPKAVELATRTCTMTDWTIAKYANGLAAACAETGDFATAVKREKQALDLLSAHGQRNWRVNYQMRLDLYESGKPYHMQSPRSLVAWWKLDEAIDRSVQDSSGNSLHGKLIGDARIVNDAERNGVLSLDGRGHVDCGTNLAFDIQGPMTLSAWVRLHTLCDTVISKGHSAWGLSCRGGLARFTHTPERNVPSTSQVAVDGHTDMRDGKWHHVVGWYDGREIRVYVDGSLNRSEPVFGIMAINPCNVYIGLNPETKRYAWNGLIDDVRIHNYALSEAEIEALAAGKGAENEAP